MKSRTKHILAAFGVVLLVVLVLGGIKAMQISAMIEAGESFQPPPTAVTTATVKSTQWRSTLSAVGTTVSVQGVQLTAEVGGTVEKIAFKSGQRVKKGDVLLRMDAAIERAALASAKASARLASLELDRFKKLKGAEVASSAEFDNAEARYTQAKAQVQNTEATIAKKTIRAPFSGRIGIREVNIGQTLSPGAPIVSLHSFDPIYADFSIPQDAISKMKVGDEVRVVAGNKDGAVGQGKIETIDTQLDPRTRNVRVRALMENKKGRFVPGMFVEVEVQRSEMRDVLLIPSSAVLYAPFGDSVFVVKQPEEGGEDSVPTVEQTFVRLGERRGDLISVVSGIQADQTVVSTGAFKLQNGMPITIDNSLAPEVSAEPSPANQ